MTTLASRQSWEQRGGVQHLRGDPWRRQTRSELLNRMGKQQLRPPVLPTTLSLLSNSRTQNHLRWEEMFPIAYLHAFRPSFVDSYVSAKTACWNDVVGLPGFEPGTKAL